MPIKSATILACAACTCIGYYFGTTRAPQETEAASLPTPPSVSAKQPTPAPAQALRFTIPPATISTQAANPTHPYEVHKALLEKTHFPLLDESGGGSITPQAIAFLGITPAECQTIQNFCRNLTAHINTLEKASIKQLENKNEKLRFEIPPIASQIADDIEKTKTGIINLLGEERGSFMWDRLQKTHGSYFADFGIYRTELTVSQHGDQLMMEEDSYNADGHQLKSTSAIMKELPARYQRLLELVR